MALKCSEYLHCPVDRQEHYAGDGKLSFRKCNSCGLIWRSPDSEDITKEYGEDYFTAKNYLKNRAHKIRKSRGLINIALDTNPEIKSLLEVGCSLGNTLEAARAMNIEHLGLDVSRFAVDFCLSKGLNADNKPLEELAREGKRFDLLFMQHVLEHFPDPFRTLMTCWELLNPNGLLLIMVPNSLYRSAARKRENHRFYKLSGVGSEHFVYFNYDSLERVLAFCGFRIALKNYPWRVKSEDNLPFFLNRVFRRMLTFFRHDQEILVIGERTPL